MDQVLQKYTFGSIIGKGASGEIHEAKLAEDSTQSSYQYAIKIIKKDKNINDENSMFTELSILQMVRHPNVVQMVDEYEFLDTMCLVMQRSQGDLFFAISKLPTYMESTVKSIFCQLLDGVSYLHGLGIVHRDLKLSNILCDIDHYGKLHVKITDFGVSAFLHQKESLTALTGTRPYFAPEMYRQSYGQPADIWALGCVFVELLTGDIAFAKKEQPKSRLEQCLFRLGVTNHFFDELPGWKDVSDVARSLVYGMLKENPSQRLSIAQCLQHQYLAVTNYQRRQQQEQQQSPMTPEMPFPQRGGSTFKRLMSWRRSSSMVLPEHPSFAVDDADRELSIAHRILKQRHSSKQRRFSKNLLLQHPQLSPQYSSPRKMSTSSTITALATILQMSP